MSGTWFRLDVDFDEDARLWDAGWEATLLWPLVLSLLKKNDGVLDDRTLSGRYLARRTGCPADLAERGVEAIKHVGLLVSGSASWKIHQGFERTRKGWISLRWADKGNASSSWRILAQPSATLEEDGATLANHSRARCPVPYVPSRPVASVSSEKEPPKPPTGGKKKSAKRAASTAANRVFDLWADLAGAKPADGTKVKTNNLRRIDRYIKEHSEREIEAVIRHLADDPWWRGKTAKQTTDIYRAGVHKFLNGAEEVASRVNAAMNNPEANGGEWTDCPDDYPTPLQYDVVALRGFNVGRFPSGGWDPSRKQYANGILPWRTFLEAAAKERLSVPGADLYVPEHYRRHLAACPFVVDGLGEVSSVDGKVEWAYTEVLNDIRQERGML